MLVNLTDILKIAEKNQFAVGAFNTPNLEGIETVIDAAEKLNVPVIIAHAELHEEISPLHIIGPVMVQAAKAAKSAINADDITKGPQERPEETKIVLKGDRLRKYFPDVSMTPREIEESIYSALEERRQRQLHQQQKPNLLKR